MNTYVYITSQTPSADNDYNSLYTAGFYAPNGKWEPESDHTDKEKAAERVHYLNGGKNAQTLPVIVDADTVWLVFETPTGKRALINIESLKRGSLVTATITEWIGGMRAGKLPMLSTKELNDQTNNGFLNNAYLRELNVSLNQQFANETDRVNKRGHIEPDTKRYCLTVDDFINHIDPDHPAWLYLKESADMGLDPWREIDGLNPILSTDANVEIWLADSRAFITGKLDTPIYVQQPIKFAYEKSA